jgi:hypothetical protein
MLVFPTPQEAHFSRFMKRGARRVESQSEAATLGHVAVENPEGTEAARAHQYRKRENHWNLPGIEVGSRPHEGKLDRNAGMELALPRLGWRFRAFALRLAGRAEADDG